MSKVPVLLLSLRSNPEQRAISLIRLLAGDAMLRYAARHAIRIAGGDERAIATLGRLVGAALIAGLEIELPDCPYLNADEQFLLSKISQRQEDYPSIENDSHSDLNNVIDIAADAMRNRNRPFDKRLNNL